MKLVPKGTFKLLALSIRDGFVTSVMTYLVVIAATYPIAWTLLF